MTTRTRPERKLEKLEHERIIISGPNENSQKASISALLIIMIRTGSQMENKRHENVSKKVGRPKEHTG